VGDSAVVYNLNFPIEISKPDGKINLEKFIYREEINIGNMVDFVNQIVDKSIELNEVPEDVFKDLIDKYDLEKKNDAKLTHLVAEGAKDPEDTFEGDVIEYEDYVYYIILDVDPELEERFAFGIQYDIIGRGITG
tara:strand:- start:207 stop:611 length:405 start_codon:yes stop_codon:yes gene_type:complete